MSSLAKQQPQHHQQQQMVPAPLSILSTGGADGRDHSRCPPPTGGVRVTPHPSLVLEGKNQQSRLGKAATGAYLGEGRGSVIGASPSAGQQQQQQHQEELSPAFSAESCRGLLNVCTAEKLLKRRSKTQQAAVEIDVHQTQHPQALKQRPQQQQQQPPTVGQGNSQQCSGSRRRPRSGISSSRGHRTRPPAPLGQGGGPLGGYTIRQGGPGSLYRADGGDGQAGVGRSGIGHGGQQVCFCWCFRRVCPWYDSSVVTGVVAKVGKRRVRAPSLSEDLGRKTLTFEPEALWYRASLMQRKRCLI